MNESLLKWFQEHYGAIGTLFYVFVVVHGKSLLRWFKGTYVSWEKIDARLNKLEADSLRHEDKDEMEFREIKEQFSHLMSEMHTYISSARTEQKELSKDMTDLIIARHDALNLRIDKIFEKFAQGR